MKHRRWLRSFIILAICMMLTGCWDSTEIDRLAIVTATGIDVNEQDPSTLIGSAQIAVPSELGTTQGGAPTEATGSTQTFIVLEGIGKNPADLLEQARKKVPRKLIMSHRAEILVGEKFARQGVSPLMDEVARNPQSRLRTAFLVAYENRAVNIIKLPYPLERLPALAVKGFAKQLSSEEFTAKEFMERLLSKSDPYAIGIEAIETGDPEEKKSFIVRHIAVFQRDKLVGWLHSGDEVNGFLWLRGKMKPKLIDTQISGYKGSVGTYVLKPKTITTVKIIHGKPQIFVRIRMRSEIISNGTSLDLQEPKNVALVESAVSKKVSQTMSMTLNLLQHQYHADPVGFADLIYAKSPSTWQRIQPHWREELAHLPVHLDVKVDVPRSGLSMNSLIREDGSSAHE